MKNIAVKKYRASLLLFVFFLASGTAFAQQKAFNWTLALQNFKTGETLPFSGPVQSWTGEQFRLVLSPDTPCFAYVIIESGEDLTVLHSGSMKSEEPWYSPVLELSPPRGTENFFVVTSREEQKNLAQRISAFNSNSGSTQKRALLNEIFRLRSDVSKFREAPEKPVLMGGSSRGTPEKNQGVEYSGLETYVKTISIEH